jgi:NADPH-dependent 2,4-dienoyl-CoA reductase/sulfur reductase-like enzyme
VLGGMSVTSLDLVIVGNGAAAAEAVEAARRAGFRGEIDLFADNPHPPYNPMLGTYFASGAIPRQSCFPFGGPEFYERHRINAHLECPVVRLEPPERRLSTAEGYEYAYRACLVASGAHTTFPPVPGLDLPGVYRLRSFDDAVRLKAEMAASVARAAAEGRLPHGIVLGASFAGVKVAEVLRGAGMQVCIVEKEACVLPLAAHPDCACALEQHLRDRGYELRLGVGLERVEVGGGRLLARFGDGEGAAAEGAPAATLETDLIVVCTGSRPSLDFLAAGQVATGVGLIVDEHLRTSAEGLYAAGDVAQALNPLTGRHEVVALWANARRQGRVAGANMAGVHAEYPGNLPHNVTKVGDLLFASAGSVRDHDALDLDSRDGGLAACAYKDGRLAGFNVVGAAIDAGPLVQALARGCDVRVSETGSASDWARRVTWTSLNAS